jgi:hypothetical protein
MFREGDYLTSESAGWVKTLILKMCSKIKVHSLVLIEVLAPHREELIASPLADPEGKIYDSFLKTVYAAPKCFERASWWKQIYE